MSVRGTVRGRGFSTSWWRTCVAWCALVALAWPSLGPLPYVIHDADEHFAFDSHGISDSHHAPPAGHADRAGHDHHHAIDASSMPGSPLHPIDHDCPECLVLKHLSRCVLPILAIALLPPVVVVILTPRRIVAARRVAQAPAHLPPARAPPTAIA